MIESILIFAVIFIITLIISLMLSIILSERFRIRFEQQLFIGKKPVYFLALAFITAMPMNLAILLNTLYGVEQSYTEASLFLIFNVIALTTLNYRRYKNFEHFGTYCIHYTEKNGIKRASIHFTPRVNAMLASKAVSTHTELKKLYNDIIFDSLDKIKPETSILTFTSPMLRSSSHAKIAKALIGNPKVRRVEPIIKHNLLVNLFYFSLLFCVLGTSVKMRVVHTVNIALNHKAPK